MGTPFLGELKLVSFNFAPKGWTECNGQLLPINQNQALFALLGTMYGGDGRVNFGLPDLRSRTPIAFGNGFTQGEAGGQESHTVTIGELPTHVHGVNATTTVASATKEGGHLLGTTSGNLTIYSPAVANLTPMNVATVTNVGGSQPHENRQPFLVLNWIIALQGIFPSRN